MSPPVSDRPDMIVGGTPEAFVHEAREHGLGKRLARKLEQSARELFPEDPTLILEFREEFEEAAMHAVIGDAGNLELSFKLVDMLASAVETLGLARASDVPDPFRRVWVSNDAGNQVRGVVLRCGEGEVSVFCPPSRNSIGETGDLLRLSYRGFSSSVDYKLRLNDAVRLPGAHVMHLTRLDGRGAIGRKSVRYEVSLQARVFHTDPSGINASGEFMPCKVLDISRGGLRLEGPEGFEEFSEADNLCIELPIQENLAIPFAVRGEVLFIGTDHTDSQRMGIRFGQLSKTASARLERFLETLEDAE